MQRKRKRSAAPQRAAGAARAASRAAFRLRATILPPPSRKPNPRSLVDRRRARRERARASRAASSKARSRGSPATRTSSEGLLRDDRLAGEQRARHERHHLDVDLGSDLALARSSLAADGHYRARTAGGKGSEALLLHGGKRHCAPLLLLLCGRVWCRRKSDRSNENVCADPAALAVSSELRKRRNTLVEHAPARAAWASEDARHSIKVLHRCMCTSRCLTAVCVCAIVVQLQPLAAGLIITILSCADGCVGRRRTALLLPRAQRSTPSKKKPWVTPPRASR